MTLCCDNGTTFQLSPLRMCNLWQTATPSPIILSMWLLSLWIFSFRNSLSHSLQVQAYLRFASLNPNLLNYDPNCTSVILTSSRFYAVAENDTIFSAGILIHAQNYMYSSCMRSLATATSSKDTMTHRPRGILPIEGRDRGCPVPQNSCRPAYPLTFSIERGRAGGYSISLKNEHRPSLRN